MIVVLDTNVFVSGVFFKGLPYEILNAWRKRKFDPGISQEILEEYRRVGKTLREDHPTIELEPILHLVVQHAKLYDPPALPAQVCEDPDDDKFIACALASGDKIIVSGDKHLIKISGFQDITVYKPRAFFDKVLG